MRTLLLLAFLVLACPVRAQALRVTTDKATYAYGEPIRATITLTNTRPDTLVFTVFDEGPHALASSNWTGGAGLGSACAAGQCKGERVASHRGSRGLYEL